MHVNIFVHRENKLLNIYCEVPIPRGSHGTDLASVESEPAPDIVDSSRKQNKVALACKANVYLY